MTLPRRVKARPCKVDAQILSLRVEMTRASWQDHQHGSPAVPEPFVMRFHGPSTRPHCDELVLPRGGFHVEQSSQRAARSDRPVTHGRESHAGQKHNAPPRKPRAGRRPPRTTVCNLVIWAPQSAQRNNGCLSQTRCAGHCSPPCAASAFGPCTPCRRQSAAGTRVPSDCNCSPQYT